MFTWDENKRRANLRKHGVDFADAETIFAGDTVTAEDAREAYPEQRFVSLGLLHDVVVSVTHTERADKIRIISIRNGCPT